MSCGACDCEECQESRDEDDYFEEDDDFGDEPVSERPLPPPPVAREVPAWLPLVTTVYDRVNQGTTTNVRFNMEALVAMTLREAGVHPVEYREWNNSLTDFIRQELPRHGFSVQKGREGGIFKTEASRMPPPTLRSIPQAKSTVEQIAPAARQLLHEQHKEAPKDDYKCKACGNQKLCTKTDRKCWSCGEPVVC